MKKHRLPALLLALALTAALTPPVPVDAAELLLPVRQEYSGQFRDLTGSWCEDAVSVCYETGLLTGRTPDRFDASGTLTCAQITAVSARLLALLNGEDGSFPAPAAGEAWYQPYAAYLAANCQGGTVRSFLSHLGGADPQSDRPCVRRNFVALLSGVLPEDTLAAVNDISVVIDSADTDVVRFYRAGILSGTDAYGTFRGENPLTRGAAAAMLARIVDPRQRLRFTPRSFDLCRDGLGVEPDAALLAVNGEEVPAELFAQRLCQSLLQWNGNAEKAAADAIRLWCKYDAPFRVLAAETGVALPDGERSAVAAEAQARDGLLGSGAAYWRYSLENVSLNLALVRHYTELDWKQGEYNYHQELEARAAALEQSAAQTELLRGLDLRAAYSRLKDTPYPVWVVE